MNPGLMSNDLRMRKIDDANAQNKKTAAKVIGRLRSEIKYRRHRRAGPENHKTGPFEEPSGAVKMQTIRGMLRLSPVLPAGSAAR
jgi:hypothetical protein